MATWQSANTGAFVPDALNPLISSVQTTANSAATVLNTIKAAVDLLKNFIVAVPPFDFLGALATEVQNFKTDFLGAGFYALNMWDYPVFQLQRAGGIPLGEPFSQSFEVDVINALGDERDPNRPPFSGTVAALLLVGGATSIDDTLNIVRAISEAFSWWEELNEVKNQLSKVDTEVKVREVEAAIRRGDIVLSSNPSRQTIQLLALRNSMQQAKDLVGAEAFETNIKPKTPTTGSSSQDVLDFIDAISEEVENAPYPNFQQISLRTVVPGLQQVVDDALDPIIASLATGQSIVDTINSFIETIETKIDALDGIITTINDILAQLDGLTSLTSLSALYVESSDGIDGLVDEIRDATNKPLSDDEAFFSGLVLVGGGPSLTAFQNLFAPIGS